MRVPDGSSAIVFALVFDFYLAIASARPFMISAIVVHQSAIARLHPRQFVEGEAPSDEFGEDSALDDKKIASDR